MNPSPNSPDDTSAKPTAHVPQSPTLPLDKRFKLILSVFLLTIATDFLTFGITLGLGVTILCWLIWYTLRLNRPSRDIDRKDLLLYFLMTVSAIQAAIESSFSNWLVLFLLTIYASGHFLHRQTAPYWRRALEGLFGLLDIYLAYFNLKRGLHEAKKSSCTHTIKTTIQQGRRWAMILLPAIILTFIFLPLFASGNAIMRVEIQGLFQHLAQWLSSFQFPSFFHITFFIVTGFLLLSLLSRSPLSLDLARIKQRLPNAWKAPADLTASIWSNRLLLIAVNGVFFTANTVDVFYLWMKTKLPVDINFSDFVHQGVYNLIACVALAAGVLLLIFQQDKKVTNAPGQKLLAQIWIIQNFLLVSSVLLRLKLYVDTYHLSLLRLYVAFFLILVIVGFILLAIKITQERKLSWLVNSNLLAIFLLFFFVQLLNDRAFVARYNYEDSLRPEKSVVKLDVAYLASLGPAAWPTLQRIADDPSHFDSTANLAKTELRKASRVEQKRLEKSDWRSWQYRRWGARNSLPGFENTLASKKHHSTRQRE